MAVGGDRFRLDAVDSLELPDRSLERGEGLQASHVADVLAHPGVAARRQAEGVLELAAGSQDRRDIEGQRGRAAGHSPASGGSEAPRPSSTRTTESSHGTWIGRSWTSQASAIDPSRARASASSKQMGSSLRLPLVITSAPGTGARPPGTGANSRWCSGRVRQEQPDIGVARRHRVGDRAVRPPPEQDDGPSRARQAARPRPAPTIARLSAAARSPTITAKGLSGRRFRRRSSATRSGRGGVTRQVVPTEAFDRQDAAATQGNLGRSQRAVGTRRQASAPDLVTG